MTVNNPSCSYLLVIDTDQYAGNFERQLTGFCTGVDDGTHGDRESADFRSMLEEDGKTVTWDQIITTSNDDNGFPRVCTIWPTPGRFNNGMGYHYDADGDEEEARRRSIESMKEYQAAQMAMCQGRLDREDFEEDNGGRGWTKEACERTLAAAHASIARAGEFVRFPAYESVAIFLTERPSQSDMAIFLERLRDFAQDQMQFGRRTGRTLLIKSVRLLDAEKNVVEEFSL